MYPPSKLSLVIQSLFLRVRGELPPEEEISAYCARLNEILVSGGRFKNLQLYTIARAPAELYAAPLANAELDTLAASVRERVPVPVEVYYGLPQAD